VKHAHCWQVLDREKIAKGTAITTKLSGKRKGKKGEEGGEGGGDISAEDCCCPN